MYRTSLQSRIMTGIRQCKQLLDNHYREYQIFHQGCSCGSDGDEDGSFSDYDDELCFKLQEADLACSSMHDWFADDGGFKDGTMQYEVGELFAYCVLYADDHNPILKQTLKDLIKDIEKMVPGNRNVSRVDSEAIVDLGRQQSDTAASKH